MLTRARTSVACATAAAGLAASPAAPAPGHSRPASATTRPAWQHWQPVMTLTAQAPVTRPPTGDGRRGVAGRWWRAWRARFGLAELCCAIGAYAGFAAGYLPARSVLAGAGLATLGGTAGFYGCIGASTARGARRATAHLAGRRRLSAAAWHAVTAQLASCAAAEALDDLLIRPGCLAGAAWLARPLPGGVWLGFAAGKAAADLAWYGTEALARRGLARSLAARQPATPFLLPGLALARDSYRGAPCAGHPEAPRSDSGTEEGPPGSSANRMHTRGHNDNFTATAETEMEMEDRQPRCTPRTRHTHPDPWRRVLRHGRTPEPVTERRKRHE